ncbi:MAG: hypothetical protein WA942_13220 [Mycolicibacter sinensis]|jgi:hypothetical protein
MTDRIAEPWGARTPYAAGQQWPERVDTELADGVDADEVDWSQSGADERSAARGDRA